MFSLVFLVKTSKLKSNSNSMQAISNDMMPFQLSKLVPDFLELKIMISSSNNAIIFTLKYSVNLMLNHSLYKYVNANKLKGHANENQDLVCVCFDNVFLYGFGNENICTK
jgi:hypothetical protein